MDVLLRTSELCLDNTTLTLTVAELEKEIRDLKEENQRLRNRTSPQYVLELEAHIMLLTAKLVETSNVFTACASENHLLRLMLNGRDVRDAEVAIPGA